MSHLLSSTGPGISDALLRRHAAWHLMDGHLAGLEARLPPAPLVRLPLTTPRLKVVSDKKLLPAAMGHMTYLSVCSKDATGSEGSSQDGCAKDGAQDGSKSLSGISVFTPRPLPDPSNGGWQRVGWAKSKKPQKWAKKADQKAASHSF